MTTNTRAREWWRTYYVQLSNHEMVNDDDYPVAYWTAIRNILCRINIYVDEGVVLAAMQLQRKICEWRDAVDNSEIVCNDETAANLFCRTQQLRAVLLELSDNDDRFSEEDTSELPPLLFCDFLKILDAQQWCNMF